MKTVGEITAFLGFGPGLGFGLLVIIVCCVLTAKWFSELVLNPWTVVLAGVGFGVYCYSLVRESTDVI